MNRKDELTTVLIAFERDVAARFGRSDKASINEATDIINALMHPVSFLVNGYEYDAMGIAQVRHAALMMSRGSNVDLTETLAGRFLETTAELLNQMGSHLWPDIWPSVIEAVKNTNTSHAIQ